MDDIRTSNHASEQASVNTSRADREPPSAAASPSFDNGTEQSKTTSRR